MRQLRLEQHAITRDWEDGRNSVRMERREMTRKRREVSQVTLTGGTGSHCEGLYLSS